MLKTFMFGFTVKIKQLITSFLSFLFPIAHAPFFRPLMNH